MRKRKGFSELLTFVVILGVVASIIANGYPPIQKAIYNILNSVPKQYNSTDTVVFDKDGNVVY